MRDGGRYHIVMKSPDGEEHDVSGVYRQATDEKKRAPRGSPLCVSEG
ncbi:MAG: hypothetical protein ACT4NU_01065 [Chromatiales bacterium]